MSEFTRALEYIHGLGRFSTGPSLVRIAPVLKRLGNPQYDMKFVHVAGTNGKGSTCAYVSRVLMSAGYRTGLFVSPYLESFNERISINGVNISDDDIAELTRTIRTEVLAVRDSGVEQVNEFEFLTAMAFVYFQKMGCDIAVLEAGLGGRFDSTNIIGPPAAAGITRIDYDHMAQLGDSLKQIAWQKAGIIKRGSPVVIYPEQNLKAAEVLQNVCREKGTRCIEPQKRDIEILTCGPHGSKFRYQGLALETAMMGEHQVLNAVSAVELCRAASTAGFQISDGHIAAGIKSAICPGRLELFEKSPAVLLDSAHNLSGIEALCGVLEAFFPNRRIAAVMGMMSDKNWRPCVERIAGISTRFFATKIDLPRAADAEDIAQAAGAFCPETMAVEKPKRAVAKALALAGGQGLVVICGSVYLAGQVRPLLTEQ